MHFLLFQKEQPYFAHKIIAVPKGTTCRERVKKRVSKRLDMGQFTHSKAATSCNKLGMEKIGYAKYVNSLV